MHNLGQRSSRGVPGERIVSKDYYAFRGGLNLVDPFLSIQPGQLLATMNYEPFFRGGYRRVAGYERYDGRPQPHKATYVTIVVETPTLANKPSVGDTISWPGGSGDVIYISGDNLVVADYTGDDPEPADQITAPMGVYGTADQVLESDTLVDEDNPEAASAARELRRNNIAAVPGSGPIRGVCRYGTRTYAFRDNDGGTQGIMWRSSSSGWEEVPLNPILRVTSFGAGPEEGDSITGVTSGATATIARIRVKSGFRSDSSAEGYLVLKSVTGTFGDGEDLEFDLSNFAVADGSQFTPTLSPGGRYDFRIHLFSNKWTEPRMYGVNGKDPGFEYDDDAEVFALIETGMDPDAPRHIAAHNRMLFFAFQGGSVQNSAVNEPFNWSVVAGANEILAGGEVTGFIEEVNDALLVYTRDAVRVLYGQTSDEFNFVTLNQEMGGIEWTMQRIGSTIHLDQRGLTTVAAAKEYGNFITTNLSQLVQPVLKDRISGVVGSQIVRTLNLYRLWMSDGTAFVLGFHGNKPAGFTQIDYGIRISCIWSSQTEGNRERVFFGGEDGFVYEQDVGRSFDGRDIEAFVLLVFYHSNSPERIKHYRKAVLEMSGFDASIAGSIDVNYGGTGETGADVQNIGVSSAGNFWDVGNWSEFKWSEGVGSDPSFYIDDSGFNIGLHLYHKSSREEPHVLHGINITWSPRRLKREF